MNETTLEAGEHEADFYQAEVEKMLAQMPMLREQRQRDQVTIDALKVETRATMSRVDVLLAQLQKG